MGLMNGVNMSVKDIITAININNIPNKVILLNFIKFNFY